MIQNELIRRPWPIALLIIIGLSVASAANAQPANQTKSDQAKAIAGRVSTAEGEPVTNVTVQISSVSGTEMSETAKVDSNGDFKSAELRPGLYRISAFLPGYVIDPAESTQDMYRPGDTVNLRFIKGAVITGTVTSSANTPLVAVAVRAVRVRDQNGKRIPFLIMNNERLTDDRGVYRLYGLPPGTYVVSAGGPQRNYGYLAVTAFENDAPTYAASGTRDTATELTLNSGDEVTADIQYRGEAGHAISGTVTGAEQFSGQISYSATISLVSVRTREQFINSSANSFTGYVFGLYGVPDGEYEVSATQTNPARDTIASPPKRIKVEGADVTGINLVLGPLATISGRVVFENDPKPSCGMRRGTVNAETVLFSRRLPAAAKPADPKSMPEPVPISTENAIAQSTLDAKGSFTFKNLRPGNYLIEPRLPASGWFIRTMTVEAANANVARDGVTVRSGERVSGLIVTMTEGAAKLTGRIITAEGQPRPPNLRVYLVPSEREFSENGLRFFESKVEADGTFAMDNLAPGKYWIVARPPEETDLGVTRTMRQDAGLRARVIRAAQTLKKEIGFKPCEQVTNYDLSFAIPITQ